MQPVISSFEPSHGQGCIRISEAKNLLALTTPLSKSAAPAFAGVTTLRGNDSPVKHSVHRKIATADLENLPCYQDANSGYMLWR